MRLFRIAMIAIALMASCSCGSATSGDAGVTIIPSNGSTDQLIDTEVSGTFTKAIGEPQWSTVFTLTASGQTTNLCSSYTYSAPKVTCAHDPLANGATYQIEIIPFIGCSGNHGTFTTIAAVASVVEEAVPSEGGGEPGEIEDEDQIGE